MVEDLSGVLLQVHTSILVYEFLASLPARYSRLAFTGWHSPKRDEQLVSRRRYLSAQMFAFERRRSLLSDYRRVDPFGLL